VEVLNIYDLLKKELVKMGPYKKKKTKKKAKKKAKKMTYRSY
jgi:hypothetical protein